MTSIRNKAFAFIMAFLVIAVLIVWGVSGPDVKAQGTDEPVFSCNGEEEQIETFAGTADETTPPFEVTADEWRFIAQGTANTDTGGSLDVTGQDAEGVPVGVALLMPSPDGDPDTRSSSVQDGPGTFTLQIEADGVNYSVLVCEGLGEAVVNEPAPKAGSKTTPKTQPKASPPPPPPPSPSPQPKTPSTILNSGGPGDGPVPPMPGGGCPKEFPVERGGACYR